MLRKDSVVDRKKSPDYAQVVGHVPKSLALRLKFYVAKKETTITEVVERSLEEFLEKYDK